MAEFDLTSADLTVDKQIPNGLPGEAMRKSMENKNILAEKGSLYVGTGAVERVKILGNDYLIAQTGTITPKKNENGRVLVADSASTCGLSYKNISDVGGVVYNQSQSLNVDQQTQARTNIGAAKKFTAGTGLEFNSNNSSLHLTAATTSTIGGVKIGGGSGLNVDTGGALSLLVSANGNLGGIKVSVVSSLPTTLADDVFYFVTT